ncbi:zinc transporter ZIP1-like [Centruroides vittatus]|uniref:zinc transporter ZIP1-like n=1 Tax=Centruroides vittatus TaxID=120091 RepID=UPI00350F5C8F
MSLQVARIVSLLVLLVGTFLCGILPSLVVKKIGSRSRNVVQLSRRSSWVVGKSHYVTSFLMCVGGGILFSVCFLHLLPEVDQTFEEWWHHSENVSNDWRIEERHRRLDAREEKLHVHKHEFPLPQFVICSGFLFVYIFEETVKLIVSTINSGRIKESTPISTARPDTTRRDDKDLLSSQQRVRYYGTVENNDNRSNDCPYEHSSNNSSVKASYDSHIIELKRGLSLAGLLIVTALSFHSLFEGFTVGLQVTERETWTVLFAICMHKFVIALVIGIEAVEDGTKLKVLLPYMIIFSAMSPLGIVTASLAEKSLLINGALISGVLNGLATGTLLYVTFFEIMHKEKNSKLPGMFQLLGLLTGFVLMIGIDRVSAIIGE